MNDKKIYIPQAALAQTKQICAKELACTREKQNASILQLLGRFLFVDLSHYFKVTSFGCVLLVCTYLVSSQVFLVALAMYFFLLGGLGVFEVYKNHYYHTNELFYPVYLNQGRVFLYKIAAIALFEIAYFLLILLFQSFLNISMITIFMWSIVPLFLIQILMLPMIRYLHSLSTAILSYTLLFVSYAIFYYQFGSYILTYMDTFRACILGLLLIGLFAINLCFINKTQRKEGNVVWN